MFLNYSILIQAGLLIAGIWWCKEIIARLPDDVAELRIPDLTRRAVIIAMWAATVIIMGLIVAFLWNLIAHAVRALA